MNLRQQLQDALGSDYRITRELGGGGMSRVFVACEEALQREVVVKVLPPELLAGVNAERFDREVLLAARLQHPHIVPVLSASEMDGIPYYTMPFVDGASLRDRLAHEGALPIGEAVSILRDVARALAYAHERGVVHRDIKPANVLLSGGSAVVTDFGIAKAVSAARVALPGETLTGAGMSLGTPAYMSPEQAAADPTTDHRADIYSFGCMAYEMLAGRPPFVEDTPQKLLAAQMSQIPAPLVAWRPDTPPALERLVMQCLEKYADARPQRATELVQSLDTVSTGGSQETMPVVLARRGELRRALLLYVVAFMLVAVLARAAIAAVGLPDWVFPGALIVMGLGLPVILFTAYVHRTARRLAESTPAYTPEGTRFEQVHAQRAVDARSRWSWRRAAVWSAMLVTSFVVVVGGYMGLRAMGIGPAGSLLAAGSMTTGERILVTDFPGPAGDSTLGPVVTDAFRTALGQSRSVAVVPTTAVRTVLRRMQRDVNSRVDFALAREIATREGVKAVLDGNLLGIGGRYVLALRLVSAQTGGELATFRETADDQSEILPAVDRLAKEVRARIGESLRHVQSAPPLEQVTTSSLEALRLYVQGSRAITESGDFARGSALLEEAIALDTGFAMAYRKLGVEYGNRGLREKRNEYFEKAFAHRDRLSDPERYLMLGSYYWNGPRSDLDKARAAYEDLLAIQPNHTAGLNNLSNQLYYMHDYRRSEQLLVRALQLGPAASIHFRNLARTQVALGKVDTAVATVQACARALPENNDCAVARADLLWTRGEYDTLAAYLDEVAPRFTGVQDLAALAYIRSSLALLHGRVSEGLRLKRERFALLAKAGVTSAPVESAADEAMTVAWIHGDTARARRPLEDSLARHPLPSVDPSFGTYVGVVTAYAFVGRPDRARAVMAQWDAQRRLSPQFVDSIIGRMMEGHIALATGQYAEAATAFRAADRLGCEVCEVPLLARAYELSGEADSAIANYERYLDTERMDRMDPDALYIPFVHERLGALYEAKGQRGLALRHYEAFVALWKEADPVLQPRVATARQRLAVLTHRTGASR
ncbi:MAG TPA: protein kinase [Gemmatimonadaceae bacterium]|nr:protein kinase [Gemmatimonadaceae bacterium]